MNNTTEVTVPGIDTCSYCGEEVAIETLNDDDMCTACVAKQVTDEEPDDTCGVCGGCGEGQHEGTRCYACKGRGVIVPKNDDFDAPDNDYDDFFSRRAA